MSALDSALFCSENASH